MKRQLISMSMCAALLAACNSGSDSSATTAAASTAPPTTAAPTTTVPQPTQADAATVAAVQAAVDGAPEGCDPLDTTRCLLPFPSNAYTRLDEATPTGIRVAFPIEGMPASADGVAIDPQEWNRNDGFSPNTPILTHFADLDTAASNLPAWTDIGASLADDSPVVLYDIIAGQRVPLWAEIDSHAVQEADRLLTVRPAVSLPEGHQFVVAFRGLKDTSGGDIAPSDVFRVYRDNLLTEVPAVEARRNDMEAIFGHLTDAGVDRSTLQLAWSFTVASTKTISERMLH
ncbi:MAG: hypothetical protein KGR47_15735, partial [Acidobacteria bacterium]|nr:hypothetical protein [Acidobacteriota bacterium]